MISKNLIFILALFGIAGLAFAGKKGGAEAIAGQKGSIKPSWLSSIGAFFLGKGNAVHQDSAETSPLLPKSKRSKILTVKKYSATLSTIVKSNQVTSRLPFSDFTESAVIFFRTVNDVVRQKEYDTDMDDYIKPMISSFNEITINFGSFIVPKGNFHFLAYRYLKKSVDELKSALETFFETKHRVMENKIIANFWSNVYHTGWQLYATIDTFILIDSLYIDKTRFYFNALKHNLSLYDSTLKTQRLVYTLSVINDITEDRYKTRLPLNSLSFYADYIASFSVLFELTIKLANYDVLMVAHRLLNGFLALDREKSSFAVLPDNGNEVFGFSLDLKYKIVRSLNTNLHFLESLCKNTKERALCDTVIHHLKSLEDGISNKPLDWIDKRAYNFRFFNKLARTDMQAQTLPKKLKNNLRSIADQLANIECSLYKAPGSSLAVHMMTTFSGSLSIFNKYQQYGDLVQEFVELFNVSSRLFQSASLKTAVGVKGDPTKYYVYEKTLCDDLNHQIEKYGNLFRTKVLFNREDDNVLSEFFEVHHNLNEAWHLYFNHMINRRYACEEELGILNTKENDETAKDIVEENEASLDYSEDSDELVDFVSAPLPENIEDITRQVNVIIEAKDSNSSKIDSNGNLVEADIYSEDEELLQQSVKIDDDQENALIRKKAARQQKGGAKKFQIELHKVENEEDNTSENQDELLFEKKAAHQQKSGESAFKIALQKVESEDDNAAESQDEALVGKKAARRPQTKEFKIDLIEISNDSNGSAQENEKDLVLKKNEHLKEILDRTPAIFVPDQKEIGKSKAVDSRVLSQGKFVGPRRVVRKIILVESMNCDMCLNDSSLKSFVLSK